MAAPTTIASAEGSLYELVARGKKDLYFYQDEIDSLNIFNSDYKPQTPWLSEIRRIPSRTAADFGRTVDFDIDVVGDLMTAPTFLITLPTWLPPTIAAKAGSSIIQGANNTTYGYTNGIAYFLFEQIQIYQDTLLLQEFSGDALWALGKLQGTYAQGYIVNAVTGTHNGTPLAIGRNAAPPMLRLSIPFIGCQQPSDPGFPLRALTAHSFRIRAKLRRLEDLVESSDPLQVQKPVPWGIPMTQQTSTNGQPISFTSLARSAMAPLQLQLETTQVYTTQGIQEALKASPQSIPFVRLYESNFTQSRQDYLGAIVGATSSVSRRIDACHPAGRVIFFFRSKADVDANRLWKVKNTESTPSYYTSVSLLIAGQTREAPQTPQIWRDINCLAKEDCDTGTEISSMNWTLGDSVSHHAGQDKQPEGSVNFSTADRPTFYIGLSVPATTPTELHVIVEGWALYQTQKVKGQQGRGDLFQLN